MPARKCIGKNWITCGSGLNAFHHALLRFLLTTYPSTWPAFMCNSDHILPFFTNLSNLPTPIRQCPDAYICHLKSSASSLSLVWILTSCYLVLYVTLPLAAANSYLSPRPSPLPSLRGHTFCSLQLIPFSSFPCQILQIPYTVVPDFSD